MKKTNKALDHIILAISSLQEGDVDTAAEQLVDAVACDDLKEGLDKIDELQEACDDEADLSLDEACDNAVKAVASLSRLKRKRILKNAVATASLDEDVADDVDLEDPEAIVEAIVDGLDDDDAVEALSDLGLIDQNEADVDTDVDTDEVEPIAESKTALAKVLRKKQAQTRRSMRKR